jgi:hypothetical protein
VGQSRTRALAAIAALSGVMLGHLALCVARHLCPTEATTAVYLQQPNVYVEACCERFGEGSVDPWNSKWRVSIGSVSFSSLPVPDSIYSMGPNRRDDRGRDDDVLVPEEVWQGPPRVFTGVVSGRTLLCLSLGPGLSIIGLIVAVALLSRDSLRSRLLFSIPIGGLLAYYAWILICRFELDGMLSDWPSVADSASPRVRALAMGLLFLFLWLSLFVRPWNYKKCDAESSVAPDSRASYGKSSS